VARRVSTAPAPKRIMNPTELRAGIERIEKRIEELTAFDPSKMQVDHPPELAGIETAIQTTLARVFGDGTADYKRFLPAATIQWSGPVILFAGQPRTPLSDYIKNVQHNRERSLVQLREAVRVLQEDLQDCEPFASVEKAPVEQAVSNKIFIVHGRDNDAKNEVARFLGKIRLEEIILHERPNQGRHLLTKFQEESEGASFAVVLMTPDDEGGLPGHPPQKRARQNVVFELGFFIGKMGPSRVAALLKGDVEKPSDFDGVGYIQLDPAGAWKGLLARELKAAKVPFDPAKVFEA